MMYSHNGSIAAAAISRRQSGLTGTYAANGRKPVRTYSHHTAMAGPLGDAGSIAAGAAADFLASDNDVDKLYEPLFTILDKLTYLLPAPFDVFVKLGLSFAKQGPDATRNALKTAARAIGRYTPIGVGEATLTHMVKSAPLTFWNWAARDKMAQNASNSSLFTLAISAYNAAASENNKLNLNVRTRLADQVQWLLKKNGATPQQAAMVAWTIAKSMGVDAQGLYAYAAQVGAKTPEEFANPEIVWERLYGDKGEGAGAGGGGGGALLPILGVGLIALLASR